MRTLHIMSGLPASGKSTYCEAKAKEHGDIVIHRDEVRNELRELLDSSDYFPCHPRLEDDFYMAHIRAAIGASDKDIWIDQTTLSNGSARKILYALDRITELDKFKIIIEVLRTPYKVCVERNAARKGYTRVPDDTMESMKRGFNISLGLLDILGDYAWINNISISYIKQ